MPISSMVKLKPVQLSSVACQFHAYSLCLGLSRGNIALVDQNLKFTKIMDLSCVIQNSDESNNVVVIETSDSEFDDEDKDSWRPMQENEYKLHKLIKSAFAQPVYSKPFKHLWCSDISLILG